MSGAVWELVPVADPRVQAATQHRGSMSSHNYQAQSGRIRAESLSGRLGSDSNLTPTRDESPDTVAVHPVEERARTAVLPPIMVGRVSYRLLGKVFPRPYALRFGLANGKVGCRG